eukprot:CAMPEP_0116976592 /NCGR_PEP_ID=MMETSP0467-20121206/56592_1 /TAXON_ID=283647 /ORGANISM="Mesodinium pulex, Strain SPMC105" /LENGTH=70 /DNA_ID=CAMNT_0004669429 /DNA_START=641 /DNA_END=853 /DNA_ORIENTATION=-
MTKVNLLFHIINTNIASLKHKHIMLYMIDTDFLTKFMKKVCLFDIKMDMLVVDDKGMRTFNDSTWSELIT